MLRTRVNLKNYEIFIVGNASVKDQFLNQFFLFSFALLIHGYDDCKNVISFLMRTIFKTM